MRVNSQLLVYFVKERRGSIINVRSLLPKNKLLKGIKTNKIFNEEEKHFSQLSGIDLLKAINTKKIYINGEKPYYQLSVNEDKKEILEDLLKENNYEILKEKDITHQVCPLQFLPYQEQLSFKLLELQNNFKNFNFQEILSSPIIDGYRNKNEFTFGYNKNKEITVGFRQGLYQDKNFFVERPTDCKNVSEQDKQLCLKAEEIAIKSGLPIYDLQNRIGYWRQLLIRRTTSNDVIILFQVNSTMSDETKEHLKIELPNTNLMIQVYGGSNNFPPPDTPIEVLSGKNHITERLFDFKFKISPNSFFQVNTKGNEVLISKLIEWSKESDVLLDLCCGTGSIGITLSKYFKKIIGIELLQSAVIDAINNAELNNLQNAQFIMGKLEDKLESVLMENKNEKIFAIIDPPRAGLHPKVRKTLLKSSLKEFIYVSCNPRTLEIDYEGLKGKYKIEKSIAIDLFPHTIHCETIVHFVKIE